MRISLLPAVLLLWGWALTPGASGQMLFQDDFADRLGPGWSWIREDREAWRMTSHGLEVRIDPGNMWGPANDAHNLLIRPAPALTNGPIAFSVRVANQPTNQYEQVDLVWYYNDGHMVKLGRELVDGQLSIVMGREAADKTRTIKIIPIAGDAVFLRLTVQANEIRGHYRLPGSETWREVGQCDLPASGKTEPQLCLQCYQGPAHSNHWARLTEFRVLGVDRGADR